VDMMAHGCIIAGYLDEQIVNCARLQRSANEGTPLSGEWKQIKEILCIAHYNHVSKCAKCIERQNAEALQSRKNAALSSGSKGATQGTG
jgi:hypothetical protein